MIWGGQKVTRHEKMVIFFLFLSNQVAKWNKKMGGRSFVIIGGVIGTILKSFMDLNVLKLCHIIFFFMIVCVISYHLGLAAP